ncbi:SDR family NAD(P)-dependent oxidoreductase [Actinoplanes sp. NPDC049596]|uniref:SDR family oxidoreductase n=1 Tax=unclassified Actinoplanes TaxID=2626549 RepID=UPI0034336C50
MQSTFLAGTVALVTGASSGIGQQIAEDLARQGAAVGLVARRQDRMEAHVARLRELGARAEMFPADLTGTGGHHLVEQEPGAVRTELTDHIRDGVRETQQAWYDSLETLQAHDVAEAVTFMVTRPRHVAVAEVRILPTEQQ